MPDKWGRPTPDEYVKLAMGIASTAANVQSIGDRAITMKDKSDYKTYMTKFAEDHKWVDGLTPEKMGEYNAPMLNKAQKDWIELDTAKTNHQVEVMHKTWLSAYDSVLESINGLEDSTVRNVDGTIKDHDAYRYHMTNLLKNNDKLNTQWDFVENTDGKPMIDWEKRQMKVINQRDGTEKWVTLPTETDIKSYLGRYFNMSSNRPVKTTEGMKNLIDDMSMNAADIRAWNHEQAKSAEILTNPKTGEKFSRQMVRDPLTGGKPQTLYKNITNPGHDMIGVDGANYMKRHGFVTQDERKKDLDISLKKAQINTEKAKIDFYEEGRSGDSKVNKRAKEILKANPNMSKEEAMEHAVADIKSEGSFNLRLKEFYKVVDPFENLDAPDPEKDPEAYAAFRKEKALEFGPDIWKEVSKADREIKVTGGISNKSAKKSGGGVSVRATPVQALQRQFPDAPDKTVKYLGKTKFVKTNGEWKKQ